MKYKIYTGTLNHFAGETEAESIDAVKHWIDSNLLSGVYIIVPENGHTVFHVPVKV